MSKQTFASLGVSETVASALAKSGIAEPFPVQRRVIPDALAGRDLLVKSPTGSGKSLAFGVPLVDRVEANTNRRPQALILVPTRELASQIVEALRPVAHARALKITAVYGGAGLVKQAGLASKAHIVVATPGRLEDLLQRGAITLENVRTLVLDEADRMLDMGFQPAVEKIVKRCPRDRQTMLFSATLDARVEQLAGKYTDKPRRHEEIAFGQELRGETEHRFIGVDHTGKLDALVHELRHTERGRTLVFVRTKRGADRLVKRLRTHDLQADAMHGDKSQNQRERALAAFTSGKIQTLIATDVAARGIDVTDVTHVIQFDAPAVREDYVHRVGRTARAGKDGVGITFVVADQAGEVGKIARELKLEDEFAMTGFSNPDTHQRPHRPQQNGGRSQGGRSSQGRSSGGRSSQGGPRSGGNGGGGGGSKSPRTVASAGGSRRSGRR
jgi:superfamily II DNA/RNA helicase